MKKLLLGLIFIVIGYLTFKISGVYSWASLRTFISNLYFKHHYPLKIYEVLSCMVYSAVLFPLPIKNFVLSRK